MAADFEAVRKEHYGEVSNLQTSPDVKNKIRNLIDTYVDSSIMVQRMRAANHRWANNLSKYAGELKEMGFNPPQQQGTVIVKITPQSSKGKVSPQSSTKVSPQSSTKVSPQSTKRKRT